MVWKVVPGIINPSTGGGGGSSVLTLGQLQAVSKLIPIFNSDSDALSGLKPDGTTTTPLFRGDVYKAGANHYSAKEGTEIIIP